jgi:hypothetical protein
LSRLSTFGQPDHRCRFDEQDRIREHMCSFVGGKRVTEVSAKFKARAEVIFLER